MIGRSRKTPNGRNTVHFNCDRGGRPPVIDPSKKKQRDTTTRRTGCLFSITAKESLCKTIWELRHGLGAGWDQHNHKPSFSQRAHPTLRQLSGPEKSAVQQLANAGVAAKEIRSYLHMKNPDILATNRDIYSLIVWGKRELAKGQSNIYVLADHLESEGF